MFFFIANLHLLTNLL